MPANKYALLRYRIIDRSIRNTKRPYPSKEDLRQACEEALYGSDGEHISLSTIDKDIWAMRNENELGYYAPIKFSKEYGGYFYEDPDFTIAEVPLNDDDLHAIRAAAETLFQFKDIPLFRQFDAAIEKILDRMKISAADTTQQESEIIQFERLSSYKGSEFLQPLFQACAEKRSLIISYQKFGEEVATDYLFTPYILKEYRNRWYVIGMDGEKNHIRTLSLDRIAQLQDRGADPRQDRPFDARSFFEHAVGITVTDEAPQEVIVLFSARLAPYLLTQPLHHSQQHRTLDDGRLEVRLNVLVTIELVSTILSFAQDAEVVAPTSLREEVKRALKKCLDNYQH